MSLFKIVSSKVFPSIRKSLRYITGPPAVAGSVLENRVCPSFRLSVQVFSCNCIISFFCILAWCWKPIWNCLWQSQIFWKNCFCPKIWENGSKMGQKQVFWIYWKIWSLIFTEFVLWWKLYLLVPVQILYLGKFLFLRYGSKSSQPIRMPDFLMNHISKPNQ